MSRRTTPPAALALAALVTATPVAAQYDRDGRYVPSPMGVPQDPYARPVPGSSGSPGARGEPIWPRGAKPPPAETFRPAPPPTTPVPYGSQLPPVITLEQCKDGWSAATNVPKADFNRRCKGILARAKTKQD